MKADRPGSSPLARGLRRHLREAQRTHRIIPARAGFTRAGPWGSGAAWDHPRSRGVYAQVLSVVMNLVGSSPLARGLQGGGAGRVGVPGIIPARAGFTWSSIAPGGGSGDHPRSRGVYGAWPSITRASPGSSPLARGLPLRVERPHGAARIIPARAGFTPTGVSCSIRTWDHPRSRGVYSGDWVVTTPSGGSSPLARGLRSAGDGGDGVAGIIPARAGFTHGRRPGPRQTRDHPRSRGVYAGTTPAARRPRGSSPLARGLLRVDQVHDAGPGIIPARAGFTS